MSSKKPPKKKTTGKKKARVGRPKKVYKRVVVKILNHKVRLGPPDHQRPNKDGKPDLRPTIFRKGDIAVVSASLGKRMSSIRWGRCAKITGGTEKKISCPEPEADDLMEDTWTAEAPEEPEDEEEEGDEEPEAEETPE